MFGHNKLLAVLRDYKRDFTLIGEKGDLYLEIKG